MKKRDLALEIINSIRRKLSQKMNYLTPVIYYLTPLFVEEREAMCTDGHYLFLNEDHLIHSYKKNAAKLTQEYMHILAHCILGHIHKRQGTYTDILDLAADCAVTYFLCNTLEKGAQDDRCLKQFHSREFDQILRNKAVTGVYDYLCQNPARLDEITEMKKSIYMDTHRYWNTLHPAVKAQQQRNANLSSHNEWRHFIEQYQQEIRAGWDNLRNIAKELAGKEGKSSFWGNQAGNMGKMFTKAQFNDISYKEFLIRFMREREVSHVDPDSFDYQWYITGLNLYGNIPMIEPLEYREERKLDQIIIALDTSGSCSDIINVFLRETYNILKEIDFDNRVEIRLLQCDTKIHDDRVIKDIKDIPDFSRGVHIKGFGGTDFRPVFTYIQKLREKGELEKLRGLLFFSDGFGEFPSKEPTDYETVFIMPDSENKAALPSWITRIWLTEEELLMDRQKEG